MTPPYSQLLVHLRLALARERGCLAYSVPSYTVEELLAAAIARIECLEVALALALDEAAP